MDTGFGVESAGNLPLVGVRHKDLARVCHRAQVDSHRGLAGLLGRSNLRRMEIVIGLLLRGPWGQKGHFRSRDHLVMAAVQVDAICAALHLRRLDHLTLWLRLLVAAMPESLLVGPPYIPPCLLLLLHQLLLLLLNWLAVLEKVRDGLVARPCRHYVVLLLLAW